ncbi:MAG: NADH-quinone oxidoreductase subunit J [Firmicutes bacterium]|nr:NADH-quinone oxidoreductase subunit J [Bacillota bacterium]
MAILYGLTAAAAVALGIWVFLSNRAIVAGFALVGVMVLVGLLFWELGSPMLAGLQVLVYAGGVLVTMLFVIMLASSNEVLRPNSKGWLLSWVLVPLAGWVAYRHYPRHITHIGGAALGHWLLARNGVAFEMMAMLLLAALATAIVIHVAPAIRPVEAGRDPAPGGSDPDPRH